MKHKILFVDDEQFRVTKFKVRLEVDFDVIPLDSAGEVIEYFEYNHDVTAMVLDVMMPTPLGVADSETDDGLLTGIYLLKKLRKILISLPCPVAILTNRKVTVIEECLTEVIFPPKFVSVCLKTDTDEDALATLVAFLIKYWGNKTGQM